MKLKILDNSFAIVKTCGEFSVEHDHLSLFCEIKETGKNTYILEYEGDEVPHLDEKDIDCGWKALRTEDELKFSDFGVLATILAEIAALKLSVLVVSSFDHDYIFVKDLSLLKNCKSIELC